MAKPKSLHPKRGNNQGNSRTLTRSRNRSNSSNSRNSRYNSKSRYDSRNSRSPSYNPRNPNQQDSNLNSSLIVALDVAKLVISKVVIVCLAIIRTFVMLLKRDEPIAFGLNFRKIFAIVIIILIAIVAISTFTGSDNVSEVKSVNIGSNSIGNVVREGPYGDSESPTKIAIILGTHPRESGAHKAMYKALKDNANNLTACYYVYKINVVNSSTDFEESRMNGQKLAKEFVVKDIVSNNFTFAVDTHYSNGVWGVPRFVFTPFEQNQLSYKVATDLTNAFNWIDYFNPGSEASSPAYLTTPLNQQGVPAIIYESYTEDGDNVTYQNDVRFIKFLDNYNWGNS